MREQPFPFYPLSALKFGQELRVHWACFRLSSTLGARLQCSEAAVAAETKKQLGVDDVDHDQNGYHHDGQNDYRNAKGALLRDERAQREGPGAGKIEFAILAWAYKIKTASSHGTNAQQSLF